MSAVTKIEETSLSPQQQFRHELDRMGDQFAMALPSHIKPEKFQRVVMTAVLSDPAILNADRKSLLEAAIRAAQDGLLPDKREAAFVVFNTKVNGQWVKAVQFMPMIGGVIKRIHQSGEVAMITAKVVFGGDSFRSWIDDEGEHLAYEQAELPDYDTIRQVFAMAKMKDGSIYVETLTPRDIEKIRSVSRSKDGGPWTVWWEEMAKKSAIRRLSKRLPLSTEIHDMIARDDALYDLSRAPEARPSLGERLSQAKTGSLTDAREGFDRSFIEGELRGSPETAMAEETASADESGEDGALAVSEEASEGSSYVPTTYTDMGTDADAGHVPETGEVDPADEREEPTVSEADRKRIATYARDLFTIVSSGDDQGIRKDRLGKSHQRWKTDIEKMPDEAQEMAKRVLGSAQAINKGEVSVETAAEFFAVDVLDVPLDTVMPKGGE